MAQIPPALQFQLQGIAADRTSGASELLRRSLAVLSEALATGQSVLPVARALCDAQPSMASIWNAALQALAAEAAPGSFDIFVERVRRSERAVVRFALELLATDRDRPLRVTTCSFSRTVLAVVQALARTRDVRVACGEGRPMLEGRRLAAALATEGVTVTLFTDAALGHALSEADAVLVGADAMTPRSVINKSGTRLLAAAAAQGGVPVYVLATRDKFVSEALSRHLVIREHAPEEVWDSPPAGVSIRNPYFEETPLDLVTAVITDAGAIGGALVPDVCATGADAALIHRLTAR